MLGREIHQPIDLMLGTASLNSQEKDVPNYLLDLQNTMMETQNIARDHIKGAQIRQKKDYDSKILQNSFEIGDVVLKVDSAKKTGQSPKLKPPWKGPYVVVEVKTPVLFKISDKKQKDSVIHHDRLKLCQDREHPIRVKKLRNKILRNDTREESYHSNIDPESEDIDISSIFGDLDTSDTEISTDGVPQASGAASDLLVHSGQSDGEESNVELSQAQHSRPNRDRIRRRPQYLRDYVE